MSVLVLHDSILRNTSSGLNHDNLKSFGPVTAAGFDFTPLFEDTILSLLPSALLLLCLPYRIISLHGQRPKVSSGGFLRESKQAFLAMFAVIHLALLILHILSPSLRTATTIAASALAFIASLGLCLLSHLEHSRSIRPSPIINGYILLTLVFDIARVRTLFLDSNGRSIPSLFACMISVKVMVLLAEAIEKRSILLAPYRDLSPEETSGIYSKSFFFWLNELMTSGFRRVLHNHDLYPIDRGMSSEVLQRRMKHSWSVASQGTRRALFWAVLRANFKPIFYCVVPRLFQIGFRYTQPFLLTRTISFAGDESQPDSIGWGLAGAFFVVLLGVAISNGIYYHMTYRFVTSARGNLISLIYAKTVDLSITELDESVAVTLMSSDVQSICDGFENINNLWAMPIELTISLYLLTRQLGIASVAPAALAAFSSVAIISIAKFMGLAQKVWMESIQTRVDVTATMLGSMKSVKMLGFTDWLAGLVQGLRVKELKDAELFRKLLIVRVFLANLLLTLGPFVTFAVYALHPDGAHVLNADTAYTVLTLLSLLAWPVNDFIRSIPSMNAALASLNRIQEFLQSETRRDHRIFLEESPKSTQHDQSSSDGIELTNLNRSMLSSEVIVARDVNVSWKQDADFSVHDVNLSVAKGQIHMIIGPTGCGKSTLMKGILGETPSTKGFLYTNCRETAFVDQTPWIRNTSLKDNILGVSVYHEAWYNEVVRACVLDHDIAQLPNGHREPISPKRLVAVLLTISSNESRFLRNFPVRWAKATFGACSCCIRTQGLDHAG